MPKPNQTTSESKIKSLTDSYWQYFFTDDFSSAIKVTKEIGKHAVSQDQKDQAAELKAKILLKQGLFKEANKTLENYSKYSALKLFIQFLLDGKAEKVIPEFKDDLDSKVFKAQTLLFAKIYWGGKQEPELLLEEVFSDLIDKGEFEKALLASAQAMELLSQDQEFAKDLMEPVAAEQLENLLALAQKSKYNSTRAKLYLLKARLFHDRESAEDAEILFGKDQNKNGLAEVYSLYATEFDEEEYLPKALKIFMENGNIAAQGYLYEFMASNALSQGNINEALNNFHKAETLLLNGGIFEKLGLEIQNLSLIAIKGEYKKIQSKAEALLERDIPTLFKAQTAQILANTIMQIDGDSEIAKAMIIEACQMLETLGRYNQLMQAKNILFQIKLLDEEFDEVQELGEEIIQLANRLGDESSKATKYVDLAFAIVRSNAVKERDIGEQELDIASQYFNKAIEIYKEEDNLLGEADVYQSMGNLYASMAKPEDAYKNFQNARQLYAAEKALFQSAITDTLIGIMMLDITVINEHSYSIANKHLEDAFMYFQKEGFLDLAWKNAYYIADLNEKFFLASEEDRFKNRARHYYIEMLQSIRDFENQNDTNSFNIANLSGIHMSEALNKGANFFYSIREDDIATQFRI